MITALISKPIEVLDYTKKAPNDWVTIKPGTYQLEEKSNPKDRRPGASLWYVVKNTTHGCTVQAFNNLAKITIA